MPKSKNRKAHNIKKSISNFKKHKQRQMENIAKNQKNPVTLVYHKDRKTVTVPLQAWQMLNQAAKELGPLANFVAVMENIGQQHMDDGTLIPVYQEDTEVIPGTENNPGGPQRKITDEFWERNSEAKVPATNLVTLAGDPLTSEAPKVDL